MTLDSVETIVERIRAGGMVVLVDDEDRENEGDLICAADSITPEQISFMVRQGGGLVCVPVAPRIADRLALQAIGDEIGRDPEGHRCAFTISVDARDNVTTGISAADRAHTAMLLASPTTKPDDLVRPGHIFPLRARGGGVLERPGHTEAAVDLARLAGRRPAGVICEILNEDGTMARLPELRAFADKHDLPLGSVADLIAYRREHEGDDEPNFEPAPQVVHRSRSKMPTPNGVFWIDVFANEREEELVAISMGLAEDGGEIQDAPEAPVVRVHSQCFTGDVLGSLRCDCGGQLHMALRTIGEQGRGLLIYLPQEGRGIGLAAKIDAYSLQEQGLDTVEANEALGFPADLRTYEDAASILRHFGLSRVRLLTNNPHKVEGLERFGIAVTQRLPIEPGPGPVNHLYLRAKKNKLGHWFEAV